MMDMHLIVDTLTCPVSTSGYRLKLAYDALGNGTSKSDLGSYTYDATKIHVVKAAGSYTYGYDANGKVISGVRIWLESVRRLSGGRIPGTGKRPSPSWARSATAPASTDSQDVHSPRP